MLRAWAEGREVEADAYRALKAPRKKRRAS
jgi:hypothetical protein